jgi:enterochelin esterase-like enzyme
MQSTRILAAIALLAVSSVAASQAMETVTPDRARANFARPITLAPDDVRTQPVPPAGFADARAGVAAGRIEELAYASAVTGTQRKASVYLPPGYSAERRYPVLYLLHGIGGNQHEWRGYVRANAVLDNLIADGKALPMIVVMPNGRALPDDSSPPPDRVFTAEHAAGFATLAGAKHRALAGLSMGGGQALNFGLAHLDTFASVGGFSSAPNTKPAAELLPDPAAARRQLALLYLSCGNKDGLINVSQAVHRALKEREVPHVWNVDEHGHDRESWAENLFHFAQRLFR